MPEYQSKMCPVLTAALVERNGPGLAPIPCGEDACQLWWKCREPQGEAVQPQGRIGVGSAMTSETSSEDMPVHWECADLEAMATQLVRTITDYLRPYSDRVWANMDALALKALQEARYGKR